MNWWKWVLILLVVFVLGAGAFQLVQTNADLNKRNEEFSAKLEKFETENEYLVGQIEYLKNPENLLKEVKAQFNYKQQGEELIIVVPGTSTRP